MTIPRNFEYDDPQAKAALNEIGQKLRDLCPPGMGFVFLLAHHGAGGGLFYAANINRNDVCNMMREFISRHEPQ